MKRIHKFIPVLFFFVLANSLNAQKRINPIVEGYGGIIDAPFATEKPDPNQHYKIVIDVATNDAEPDEIAYSLINVARLLNLHGMGGVPKENIHVVLAIHGGAAYTAMNNEEYKKKYNVDSPYPGIYKALKDVGVRLFVCSQSIMGRGIDPEKLLPEAEVATSMLTVMTTYQLKGYAALRF